MGCVSGVTKLNVMLQSGRAIAGQVTMRALQSVNMSSNVLSEKSLTGICTKTNRA